MNLWINGQSEVPPGFRFHPTEEELLHYYLTKKLASQKIDLHVIPEIDLNKLEPWDIQEKCKIGFSPQNDCYFFSQRDKKYPTGTRTNRATAAGFWKATGRDKIIHGGSSRIGLRKTLVFYKGRAPRGDKSDWIMHEYRLDYTTVVELKTDSNIEEEGWVVCRLFKKKNYHKATNSMVMSKISQMLRASGNSKEVVDQILVCMGRTCKIETEPINNTGSSDGLPISPSSQPFMFNQDGFGSRHQHPTVLSSSSHAQTHRDDGSVSAWAVVDRLVASQLNGGEADPTPYLPTTRNGSQSPEWSSQVSVSESDFWGVY